MNADILTHYGRLVALAIWCVVLDKARREKGWYPRFVSGVSYYFIASDLLALLKEAVQ